VERDHHSLYKDYKNGIDTRVKNVIAKHYHKTMFNDAWDSIKGGHYHCLRCFSSGCMGLN
jgi:hypothetical protein